MDTYKKAYAANGTGPQLDDGDGDPYAHWQVDVPFSTPVTILCCPEDVKWRDKNEKKELCEECEVPVCCDCMRALSRKPNPTQPLLSLCNDLFMGYLPKYIYENNVTYMELICASVVQPCMISMQQRCYGWDLRQTEVHSQKHRTGARGNFTCFGLPWVDVLKQLADPVQLPRAGKDLRKLVQAVLLTEMPDNEDMSRLSPAHIRREVVIHLIQLMVDRQHPAYKDVNMESVKRRAYDELTSKDKLENEAKDPFIPECVRSVLTQRMNAQNHSNGKPAAPEA